MLAISNVNDIFGFGQETSTTSPAVISSRNVVMPAVPDDTVVRCKFDQAINGLRCSPVGLFEPPTIFLIAAAGVALLGIGYAFGRSRFLPRFTERLVEEPLRR